MYEYENFRKFSELFDPDKEYVAGNVMGDYNTWKDKFMVNAYHKDKGIFYALCDSMEITDDEKENYESSTYNEKDYFNEDETWIGWVNDGIVKAVSSTPVGFAYEDGSYEFKQEGSVLIDVKPEFEALLNEEPSRFVYENGVLYYRPEWSLYCEKEYLLYYYREKLIQKLYQENGIKFDLDDDYTRSLKQQILNEHFSVIQRDYEEQEKIVAGISSIRNLYKQYKNLIEGGEV